MSNQPEKETASDRSETFCVSFDSSVREVMSCIDRNSKGIALVTDGDGRLVGTITDGDLRRAILEGTTLDQSAESVLARKTEPAHLRPVTAVVGTGPAELLLLMQERYVQQIPILDADGRVVDLVTMEELLPDELPQLEAVIMAGGFGTRLRPLTEDTPKPMLPVGDRPLMEHTIEQLRGAGITRLHITTHYQPEKIIDHFGDGEAFGVEIEYVAEDTPLGTAGALGLIEACDQPFLVINGDILTGIDFRAMLAFHREHGADLTVGVRQYDVQVPYGVVESDGAIVREVREKPMLKFLVNAGIYLLEPSVHNFIPSGEHLDMTDLIERLLAEGRTVASFPIVEYWLDIGRPDDYLRAQEDIRNGRLDK